MWHIDDGMGWWMLLGSLWFLIFWGGIIWILFRSRTDGRLPPGNDSALDIAKRRYARGEITREQFEVLRRDLED